MSNILVIEPHSVSQSSISSILGDHQVSVVTNANEAIEHSAEQKPDLVVLEMSLAGHSGMEFLYEFRTYTDWAKVPIIIYSSLRLGAEILDSRSWKQLNVYEYIYKPAASLSLLKSAVNRAIS